MRTWVTSAVALAVGLVFLPNASAATTYTCALDVTASNPCAAPLEGTVSGDVHASGGAYQFNPGNNGTPGFIQVAHSTQINTGAFPLRVSISVMGVKVPSKAVGDYDVVRGTTNGFWKIEVMAKKNRTIAQASCSFKGSSKRITIIGGPDLAKLTGWHTLSCVDDGKQVQLFVDGTLSKSASGSTGPVSNPGPVALIGAKDTHGGDQFSGYAKNFTVSTG